MATLSLSGDDKKKVSDKKIVLSKPSSVKEPDADDKNVNAVSDNDSDDKKKTLSLSKSATPKANLSLSPMKPAAFDSAAFEKEIAKPGYKNVVDAKGKVKSYAFKTKTDPIYDKSGKVTGETAPTIHYPGSIAPHVKALAEKLKGNIDVLEAEKKKRSVTELSEKDSDEILKKNNRGDYKTHLVNMEQSKRVRDLSQFSAPDIKTKVDIEASNRPGGDAGMGGVIKMSRQTPYDSTQSIFSKPLTLKKQ